MKKLTKSATDRQVSGVLGGIAEYFGIDSTIVRVFFLILVFAGVGSPIFIYILLAILVPEPTKNTKKRSFDDPYQRSSRQPRKEAKPIKKEEDDDWSDF